MGYRSDIGAVISVDGWSGNNAEDINHEQWTKYKEMVGLIKLSKFYELITATEQDKKCIGWHWGCFFFKADNWKWYPDYDVVTAWDELWEDMQGVEGVSGYFCRVGEEVNDIVEDNFGDEPDYDAFHPFTGLSCNVANETFGIGDIGKEMENLTNVRAKQGEAK